MRSCYSCLDDVRSCFIGFNKAPGLLRNRTYLQGSCYLKYEIHLGPRFKDRIRRIIMCIVVYKTYKKQTQKYIITNTPFNPIDNKPWLCKHIHAYWTRDLEEKQKERENPPRSTSLDFPYLLKNNFRQY